MGSKEQPRRMATDTVLPTVGYTMAVAPVWVGYLTVATVDQLATAGLLIPLQVTSIGDALCQLGAGRLITAGLYLGAIGLAYMSVGDLYSGFKDRKSKSSQRKGQAGNHFGNAAYKFFGAMVIGGFPIIANAIGFDLLDCVDPIRLITG